MMMQGQYLNVDRNEFQISLNADIVQAIADGKYITDPSNEYLKWIDSMKGKSFVYVLEAMADLVADHVRDNYGVPPFMASVGYNEGLAAIFNDYEKAARALKRFDMPVVYKGHIPKDAKGKVICIGVDNGLPLWFLFQGKLQSKKLALACQYAWPGASNTELLDGFIITEGAKWRDLNLIINGGMLGVILDDTKKNRSAVEISGLRHETVISINGDKSYIVATAVPWLHDYDLIFDRIMSIVGGLYIPNESNEEDEE